MEGDALRLGFAQPSLISIHALRVEGDCIFSSSSSILLRFLSTPSGWRATRNKIQAMLHCICISIHALRVEGDADGRLCPFRLFNFYPRPPGGGRLYFGIIATSRSHFYPRPPGGGRPNSVATSLLKLLDFYPRPPGGGRRLFSFAFRQFYMRISIHALRVEGDVETVSFWSRVITFLSTPSGWRATHRASIGNQECKNFYPRPPGGGRLTRCLFVFHDGKISIHALRVEGDSKNGQNFRLFLRKREKNLPL